MILIDRAIRDKIRNGGFGNDFSEECIQPASYDLRIGRNLWSPQTDNPEKAIDLEQNGGAHRIPPYGVVILQTHETFQMPVDCVGRLGLKSSFARRGLIASTGPQVDPGFRGKLFISLMNQTPSSHVVKYKDTFLTVEFNQLDEQPDSIYQGPYQNLKTIGPEILEDLVRMEGLNLSQMQSQFTELREHVKQWSTLATRFDEFLGEMRLERETMTRHTKAIEDLARSFGQKKEDVDFDEETEATPMSYEEAVNKILQFFQTRRKEDIYYSDLMEELRIDLATVMKACAELKEKGLIKGNQ